MAGLGRLVVAMGVLSACPAAAHVGASVSNARFTSPPPLKIAPGDGALILAPYAVATADEFFTVSWQDGDTDPTGRFYFQYLDHEPPAHVLAADFARIATPIEEAQGIWASCDCSPDAGVVCPDVGVRDCRNQFTWDTSKVPAGSYWIVAVNRDPPYLVYSVSEGPVRIAHGKAPPPPAVIVLRPDGFGWAGHTYRAQYLAVGVAPLRMDLSYGRDEDGEVLGPTTPIASDIQGTPNTDGTLAYDWDVSGLEPGRSYFLRVTVEDGNHQTAFSDSRFGLTIYRPTADAGNANETADGSRPRSSDMPAGCAVGSAQSGGAAAAICLLVVALAAHRFRRRRRGRAMVSSLSLAILFVAGCRSPNPAAGSGSIRLPRLVSLHDVTTEMVVALEATDRLVGIEQPVDLAPEIRQAVGHVPLVNGVESIVAAHPDVVLGLDVVERQDPQLVAALRRANIEVFLPDPLALDDVYRITRDVAQRIGAADRAEALIAATRHQIDEAQGRSPRRPRVFVYDCCDPPFTAGKRTVLDDLIRRAGGDNIFGDLDAGWTHVSWEQVVSRHPELVVIHSYAQDGQDDVEGKRRRLAALPLLKSLPIAVVPLGCALGGLRSVEGLRRLRVAIRENAG